MATKVKAHQRRSNALANECVGKATDADGKCLGTSFAPGDVYVVANGKDKGKSRVASGACHPCSKRLGIKHHRDALAADLKVKAWSKPKPEPVVQEPRRVAKK